MYLSSLHIRQFRVFDDITLYFKNGINRDSREIGLKL